MTRKSGSVRGAGAQAPAPTRHVKSVGTSIQGYLDAGLDGQHLLHAMGRAILRDDTSPLLMPTLRIAFDEWENVTGSDETLGANHPARFQLLVGLARYATDIRSNTDSQSAATTALKFAEGKTAVDVFSQ